MTFQAIPPLNIVPTGRAISSSDALNVRVGKLEKQLALALREIAALKAKL